MTPKKLPASKPYSPFNWAPADVGAIKALATGTATPEQQKYALNLIVMDICGTYDMSYRPDSQRDTDFAEGKRFIGNTLVKLTKLNTSALKKE
jgi:hypothetical protein